MSEQPPRYTPPAGTPRRPLSKEEEAGYHLPGVLDAHASASRDLGPGDHSQHVETREENALPEYTEKDAETLWPTLPAPPIRPAQRLPLPVVLPQLTGKYDSAFVRAYCPQLQAAGVAMQDWLDFADGLNIAMVASPPLRIVDKAGMIIGFVPYHWAIIAGVVIQFSAQTAMHVLSKTLTDKYLRRANKDYFGPRGLRVRLCRTAAMRQLVGKDRPDGQPNTAVRVAKGVGMGLENVALRLPIPFSGRIIEAIHRPIAAVDPHSGMDVTGRRMQDLQGFVCPLDSNNIPPPRKPAALMDQMNDLAVKLDNHMARKREAKAMRTRRLLELRQGGGRAPSPYAQQPGSSSSGYGMPGPSGPAGYGPQGYASGPPPGPAGYGQPGYAMPPPGPAYGGFGGGGGGYGLDRHGRRAARCELRHEKHARRAEIRSAKWSAGFDWDRRQAAKDERKYLKAEMRARRDMVRGRAPRAGLMQVKVMKADRLEYNMTQELLWIVVVDAEQDAAIEGKDVVDNAEDVEYVDESDWDDEIDQEEEEDEAFIHGEEKGQAQNSETDVMTRYAD